jgi:hypothetical protein
MGIAPIFVDKTVLINRTIIFFLRRGCQFEEIHILVGIWYNITAKRK